MDCLHCKQPLGFFASLMGRKFCSVLHERLYLERQSSEAMQRLMRPYSSTDAASTPPDPAEETALPASMQPSRCVTAAASGKFPKAEALLVDEVSQPAETSARKTSRANRKSHRAGHTTHTRRRARRSYSPVQ